MKKSILGLSGNQLKILAVIFMTIDHVGLYLFPGESIFRIIGRFAFPIFAYTLSEGCKYTKNRWRYFFVLLIVGVLCQVVYSYVTQSLYQNIFITLSLSVLLVYSFDFADKHKNIIGFFISSVVLLGIFYICYILPRHIGYGFAIDYGFFGVMLPVLIYMGKNKQEKLFLLSAGLLILASSLGTIQLFSICVVPIIALYNGKRGKWHMKNFFYIYYPLHLVVIYFLGIFLRSKNIL